MTDLVRSDRTVRRNRHARSPRLALDRGTQHLSRIAARASLTRNRPMRAPGKIKMIQKRFCFDVGLGGPLAAPLLGRLVACLVYLLAPGLVPAAAATEPTRGVRLLDPGDEMTPIAPLPELKPGFAGRAAPPLEKINIAVAEGPASRLDGLIQRAAPFEIVAASEHPDLVWDAATGDVRAGRDIIAYGVDLADLPAVIDRAAVVRGIAELVAARAQTMRLVSGARVSRKGERVEVEVANVAGRALVLFDIAGDGTVQALYPIGGDERVVQSPTFRWTFQMREPFGADLIVAVSAPRSMDALEQGLKEISHYRSAGDVLKLIAIAAPPDASIGSLSLSSVP